MCSKRVDKIPSKHGIQKRMECGWMERTWEAAQNEILEPDSLVALNVRESRVTSLGYCYVWWAENWLPPARWMLAHIPWESLGLQGVEARDSCDTWSFIMDNELVCYPAGSLGEFWALAEACLGVGSRNTLVCVLTETTFCSLTAGNY